jgi:acyl carrier protein
MSSNIAQPVANRVREIIADQLGVTPYQAHDGAQLNSDLRCYSLDVVEIVMAIEEECEIVIPDWADDGKNLFDEHSTVGHVIAVAEKLVAAKAGA